MNLKFKLLTIFLTPIYWIQSLFMKMPTVIDIDKTINKICDENVSVSRYGDGEFDLIFGNSLKFQKFDKLLADRLKEILVSNSNNHIVCIPNVWQGMRYMTKSARRWQIWWVVRKRKLSCRLVDTSKVYYDARCTRCFRGIKHRWKSKFYFEKYKHLFENKDLLIIEGDKSRLGIGNDLLDKAHSIKRILCPAENAFENYDQILHTAKKYSKGRLVLIALGPTATVLAYDLHKLGNWAIDLGHLDIEYEWFLRGITCDSNGEEIKIEGKYVNEATNGNIVGECDDIDYTNQIVAKIGSKK